MKISKDTDGNRTRDLPVCSAVPQPNAPPAWELLTFPAVMSAGNCVPLTIIVRPSQFNILIYKAPEIRSLIRQKQFNGRGFFFTWI